MLLPRDYYDLNPPLSHMAGDIWSDLPTHGLLPVVSASGIVITPACDLTNNKVETVTYLPVVPVMSFLCSVAFLSEIRRAIDGQLEAGGCGGLVPWPPGNFPPELNTITVCRERISQMLREGPSGEKKRSALARVDAGLTLVEGVASGSISPTAVSDVETLLGARRWEELSSALVRNGLRADVHFLPSDGQDPEWSGILQHSLVLFRYPLTAPLELLECAQDLLLPDWAIAVERAAQIAPIARTFAAIRPTKRLRLQPRFFADLLTRYLAIYIRVGSPDFSAESVKTLAAQIRKPS